MKRFAAALALSATLFSPVAATAQDYGKYSDSAAQAELARVADVEMGVMVPMRDGVGLATNIYRPKDAKGPLPTILWKTPYNELAYSASTAKRALEAVKRGYAYIVQNERGRYFSGGDYEILGYPQTDGYDALSWIAKQPWSNGKVGTLGCSSSAEWQLALAAQNHPAHAAMVPMASGAGIGKVGRFQEQGNWYTGGVPRNLFFIWLYGVDNPLRAELPKDVSQEMRARLMRYNDLDAKKPEVEWKTHIKHLPVSELLSSLGEPPATFEQFITRAPADPAWRQGGLYHDDMGWGVPALWFNSWYDVSIGPNMALFNHARAANTDKEASANQYAVVAPNTHCAFWKLGENFVSGDRKLGDASFDVDGQIYGFFDRWLKGRAGAFPSNTPHVRYFTMGANEWQSSAQWPPRDVKTVRMYLRSEGSANSLNGDGRLSTEAPPAGEAADRYRYDPMNPVQTIGGGDCCNGGTVIPGAFDQRPIEARADVLVYTSEPLTEPMEVTGFVDAVLKVSSSARDTDFAVKLVDVAPDGTAYILGDTIMRARYRDGYDRPVLMQPGQVYTIRPTPITTSNTFQPGHRIRVEITSSNFPKFVRNLNTGGPNETEKAGVVADNTLHHAGADASYIELPVRE
ncbi:CocE/NonD family hydrolase [Sphingomonas gilva]|uniref:CocE/NonD family hydrolase n=1 Tax=Sphingomonas gilva TaxID=2305907 RepID=A0A396RSQ5_9SPHN|nr:CocE/NonD family hydrolase [Sphingomonas gilva]RHW18412.1 CocE/NonD family hydrolase [Sphingomonas gilva]